MSKRQSRELSERVGEHIRIYRRGSTFHATWQVDGKQFRQSLMTSNKKTAIKRALELDRKLAVGESPMRKEAATISEAIEAYKAYLTAEKRAAKTKSKYWRVFDTVETLARSLGRYRISQIDLPFIDRRSLISIAS